MQKSDIQSDTSLNVLSVLLNVRSLFCGDCNLLRLYMYVCTFALPHLLHILLCFSSFSKRFSCRLLTLFKTLSNHARLSIRELIHLQQLFLKRLPLIIVLTRVQTRVLVRVNACKKQKKEKRSVVKSKNLTTLSTKFKGKNVLLFCYDTIMLLLL